MTRIFIGLGSNIDPETNIRTALHLLSAQIRITGISTFYRTLPIDRPEQEPFINGVIEIETDIPPFELKQVLLKIEAESGRIRTEDKYAPRTIDLDILIYGNIIISSPQLTIPDPDILNRAFIAIPMCELAPDTIIPGVDIPICGITKSLNTDDMEPLISYTELLRQEFIKTKSANQ